MNPCKKQIAVSHSGKQYVHRFIQALLANGESVIFFTPLWWQEPPRWLKILPSVLRRKVAGEIRKRSFSFKGNIQLITRPAIVLRKEITDRIPFAGNSNKGQFTLEKRHDEFAAVSLSKFPVPMVIGYEISSVQTFRTAKKSGSTTVLDLAQVHYKAITAIAHEHHEMGYLLKNGDLSTIEARKQEEYDLADFIITLSSYARQTLIDYSIPADKIYTVHLGFDVQLFKPKKQYSKTGPLKILISGTDMTRKGLGLLIRVLRDMEAQGYMLHLTVVGPKNEVENVLHQCGHISSLRSIPFLMQEELVALYQESDLFVLPSYLDSWAMVVLEAMACGTPVIVTENTGSKDAVREGGGMIIPTGDATALHEAIAAFYHDRSKLETMGKMARSIALKYTWENYYQEVKEILNDIYIKSPLLKLVKR